MKRRLYGFFHKPTSLTSIGVTTFLFGHLAQQHPIESMSAVQPPQPPMQEPIAKESFVYLVPSDSDKHGNRKFKVSTHCAAQSELAKTMIDEDYDDEDDDETIQEIPLPNVNTEILEKVVAFLLHHVDNHMDEITKPLKSANMKENVSPWDADYIGNITQETLFGLILAANYMDIKDLLDLTCATVASQCKGKTPEEIRKTFNIDNDFTPEEEKKVCDENNYN